MGEASEPVASAAQIDALQKRVEFGKTIFGLLRDLILFAFVVILIFNPPLIDDWFSRAKIASLEAGGVRMTREANAQSRATDTQVDQAREGAERTQRQLLILYQRNRQRNPQLAMELAPLYRSIQQWVTDLTAASDQLGAAQLQQQAVLEQANPASVPTEGWISIHNNVVQVQGNGGAHQGATVVVRARPLRLRSAPGTQSPVIGVLRPGTRARILEGPRGVWARVGAQP